MKRFWIILAVLYIAVHAYHYLRTSDTRATQSLSDFKSQKDLMEFMNGFLPIRLPGNAKVAKLNCDGLQDWSLLATVVLRPNEAVAYAEKIGGVRTSEYYIWSVVLDGDKYYCTNNDPSVTGNIVVDKTTGEVDIRLSNRPQFGETNDANKRYF